MSGGEFFVLFLIQCRGVCCLIERNRWLAAERPNHGSGEPCSTFL